MSQLSQYKLDDNLLNEDRLKYLEWHRNKFKEKVEKNDKEHKRIIKEEH